MMRGCEVGIIVLGRGVRTWRLEPTRAGPTFRVQFQMFDLARTFEDVRSTQWCIFLSQEVSEISRFFIAPPTRVRPRPPRDISPAKFKFLLINLHH